MKAGLERWLKEQQDQYSIEPVIINRFPETENSMDVYVFPFPFGTFEIDDKIIERGYVTKPIEDMVDNSTSILTNSEVKDVTRLSAELTSMVTTLVPLSNISQKCKHKYNYKYQYKSDVINTSVFNNLVQNFALKLQRSSFHQYCTHGM